MIPKIIFTYSIPYDSMFRGLPATKRYLSERGETYPGWKQIEEFIKKIEKIWNKKEQKILRNISKISGLKWKEKEIKCYIVGIGRPISSPLTMKITKTHTEFIGILIHELIHNIQSQNKGAFEKWINHLEKEYSKEHTVTTRHILLHSIYYKIYLSLFNKERIDEVIKSESIPNYKGRKTSDDINYYKRSWEIVQKEGAENIIKKFQEVIK